MIDPVWTTTWENDVAPARHAALAAMLARAYPRSADVFTGRRSWSGARPELRVVGSTPDGPVAHAAVIRRFLRLPERDEEVLVADIGLVAVDPARQGTGAGGELLAHLATTVRGLGVSFGFLTCRHDVVGFYRRGGWVQLDDTTVRSIGIDHVPERSAGPAMVLPAASAVADWPTSRVVERNGQEI